jgi:hypothetical protein
VTTGFALGISPLPQKQIEASGLCVTAGALSKRMSQQFLRYKPYSDRSFSLRAFNSYESEINEHFWSFKVISDYAGRIARAARDEDATKLTADVFMATGPDARRIPTTVSQWLGARDELENWLRLSALVSASAYLEVFLGRVVRAALMADPLCRFGASGALDGTKLLKLGQEIPFEQEVKAVTRGDWNSRCAFFKATFGDVPDALTSKTAELEKIRMIRNNFAHGFGRDLKVQGPSTSKIQRADRLSQPSFVKMIGSLSKTAAAIDKFLLVSFIGSFEFVHYYHEWLAKPREGKELNYDEKRALQRSLNTAKIPVSGEFCAQLIAYYKAV